jgi:hypothetical protein
MEFLNLSLMILYALPAFFSLMLLEFLYGISRKNNTYCFNDIFCSLTLGVLSRIPPALHLSISGLVYGIAANHFSIKLLTHQNWITWVIAFFYMTFLVTGNIASLMNVRYFGQVMWCTIKVRISIWEPRSGRLEVGFC